MRTCITNGLKKLWRALARIREAVGRAEEKDVHSMAPDKTRGDYERAEDIGNEVMAM